METNFQKVERLIRSSQLGLDRQEDFIAHLALVPDEELISFSVLFSENPAMIETLYNNMKEKEIAFDLQDKMKWQTILKTEELLAIEADLRS